MLSLQNKIRQFTGPLLYGSKTAIMQYFRRTRKDDPQIFKKYLIEARSGDIHEKHYKFQRGSISRLTSLFVLLVLLTGFALTLLNRQTIEDSIKLRSYHPPVAIADLANQDTMTSYARRVYYVNNPTIDNKVKFSTVCPNGTEQTVVLGCYHSGQNGIFLLQVNDPTLQGVEQVTAAHETLHAIYERLSTNQRNQVDGWLQDYYNNDLHNAVIRSQIDSYRKTEPHDVIDEMHSVFGTEVNTLPSNLEKYYKHYFTNRTSVTDFYNHYQAAFTSRESLIKADDNKLAIWKKNIISSELSLDQTLVTITNMQKKLQQEKDSSQTDLYNSGVPGFNDIVNQYNSNIVSLQTLISQYNQLVSDRNNLALETQQLTQEISGNSQPVAK